MWDLPRPGVEPVSPALAGRFFTTEPLGKPSIMLFLILNYAVYLGNLWFSTVVPFLQFCFIFLKAF